MFEDFEREIELPIQWTDVHGVKHDKMIGRPVSMHAMRGISAHSNGFDTCRLIHILQIHKIAKIVQERMKEVESTGLDANSQQLKIAVLAAMNIADELLQSEDKKNRLITRIESKGNSFIEYIDDRIKEIESTKEK